MNFDISNLPKKFTGPTAWLGQDLQSKTDEWLLHFTSDEIVELERAADGFLEKNGEVADITKEEFSLPNQRNKLEEYKNALIDGRGFIVIRGLPIKNYSIKKSATIFCGIGTHIGSARSQNAMGHILGHVRNIGGDSKDLNTRIYQTSERQTFHTDSSDVVGLLCLKEAMEGGRSLLVSLESIYNEMTTVRPDLVKFLFDPIATDRRGEIPEGEKPYFEIPVFNWFENKLTGMYQRQYIDSAQRFDDAMRLTDNHIEALDLFDEIANDTKLHLSMQLEPGDIQLVHNHSLLHDRTGFTDWPDPEDRRHLLRLWLSVEGDRELPECFKQRFGSIKVGDRGGIITKETKLHAPLD